MKLAILAILYCGEVVKNSIFYLCMGNTLAYRDKGMKTWDGIAQPYHSMQCPDISFVSTQVDSKIF